MIILNLETRLKKNSYMVTNEPLHEISKNVAF